MENLSQKIITLLQETLKENNTTMHIVASDEYLRVRDYRTIKDVFTPLMYEQPNICIGVDNTLNVNFAVYFVKDNVKIIDQETLPFYETQFALAKALTKKVKENFTYEVDKVYELTLMRDDDVFKIYKYCALIQNDTRFIDLLRYNHNMDYQARIDGDRYFDVLQTLANGDVEKVFSSYITNTDLFHRLLKNNNFIQYKVVDFKKVPLMNVDLANVDKSIATDFKNYVFVERNNVYHGAFILDEYHKDVVLRCLYTNYITTALKNAWNETFFSAYNIVYSRYAQDQNLIKFCDFCGRVMAKQEPHKTRCDYCERFLNVVDLGEYKAKIKNAVHRVGSYDHTNAVVFGNSDLQVVDAPSMSTLYLGVEIEVDNTELYLDDLDEDDRDEEVYNRDRVANLVGQVLVKGDVEKRNLLDIKEDGSLNAGMEIVLQPATLTYHMSGFDYAKGFEVLKRFGYNAHDTDTCGLHVHINRNFFGTSKSSQLYNGAKMVYLLEKYWDDFVLFSRRHQGNLGRWAKKLDLKDDFDKQNDEMKTTANLSNMFIGKYNQSKYVALNVGHSNTFELRIFRGTLNLRTYYATLQFVDNFARLVKHTSLMDLTMIKFEDIINYKKYDELNAYWKLRKSAKGDND